MTGLTRGYFINKLYIDKDEPPHWALIELDIF